MFGLLIRFEKHKVDLNLQSFHVSLLWVYSNFISLWLTEVLIPFFHNFFLVFQLQIDFNSLDMYLGIYTCQICCGLPSLQTYQATGKPGDIG